MEDFGGEGFQHCPDFPGIRRQAGFPAGLLQESLAVPMMFEGNLRQQESATPGKADQQSMPPNLDLLGKNRL